MLLLLFDLVTVFMLAAEELRMVAEYLSMALDARKCTFLFLFGLHIAFLILLIDIFGEEFV